MSAYQVFLQSEIAVSLCKAVRTSGETARPRGRPSSTSPVPAATSSKKRKAASVPNLSQDVQFYQ